MKKSEKVLKKRIKEIISVLLCFVLVLGTLTIPSSVKAADSISTSNVIVFDGENPPFTSIFVFPGDVFSPKSFVESGTNETCDTAFLVLYKTRVPLVAEYPSSSDDDLYFEDYTLTEKYDTSLEYDSYIYQANLYDDSLFIDDDLPVKTYYWTLYIEAFPGFQIIYHDASGNVINSWGSQYYYLDINGGGEMGISSGPDPDFKVDKIADSTFGDQIGWSVSTDYIDSTESFGILYINGEDDSAQIWDEDLFEVCMNNTENGILNLYPVFYLAPSTLSVSADNINEGDELSLSIDSNRTDDYSLKFEKKNSEGTYTTLEEAPTTAGDYRVTVIFPETETELRESDYGMEIEKRGFTAISASDEFSILKPSASLTQKPAAKSLTYNGNSQTLVSAGNASNGKVLYSLSKDGEYSTDIPAAKNADTYTVWYMVKGSEGYNDISSDSVEVTISPAMVGISWGETDFTYDGEEHCPSATATELFEGDTCDVTVEGAKTAVGTYTATVTGLSNSNYVLSDDYETSFTISAANSSVKTAPAGKDSVYDGTDQELIDAGEALGGTLVYSLSENGTYSAEIPAGKNADEYTVWYMVKGDSNHNNSSKNSVSAFISPKTVEIQWSEDSVYIYDEEEHCPEATATGLCEGDTCDVTVTGAEKEIGSYTATVTELSNSNYVLPDDIDAVTKDFSIISDTQLTEKPEANSLEYSGGLQELVSGGEAVGGEILYSLTEDGEYSEDVPTGKDAGTYTVWFMVKGEDGRSDISPESIDITISPKTVGIQWSDADFIYDGEEHCPSATATGLCEGDTCSVTVEGAETEAGTYTATATGLSDSNYVLPDDIDAVTKEFSILSDTTLTEKPEANSLTYSGGLQELVSGGEAVGGVILYSLTEDGEYTENIPTGKDAGIYTVWFMVKGEDGRSNISPESIEITISPKTVGIQWSEADFIYDGEEHCPSATATGLCEGDTCSVTVEGAKTEAGTYTATATGLSNSNYVLPDDTDAVTKEFSILSDTTLTEEPEANSLTYSGGLQELITSGEAVGGVILYSLSEEGEYTENIPTGKDAGTYTVWFMVRGENGRSDISPESIDITISPKTVGIQWSDADYIYDGEEHCPGATATGLCEGDTCSVTVEGAKTEAGTYTAKITGLSNSNYALPDDSDAVTKEFNIYSDTKLTEKPEANSLTYSGGLQELTTSGKAVGGAILYSLTEDGDYTGNIPTGKDSGTYTVWFMVKGEGGRSDIAPESVEITISPKKVGIQWPEETEFVYDGAEHSLNAALTGLCEGDTCEITVTGTGTAVGTYTSKVTELSNSNYVLPKDTEKSFTISKAESSVKTAPAGKSLTYDGTEQALINSGEAIGGTLVYSMSENGTYSAEIPTGKNAGSYTIWYMVIGDENYSDTSKQSIETTISPKTIGIEWSNTEFKYDGEEHCPSAAVTGLCDGDTCALTVTGGETNAGAYTATVTGKSNDNYVLPENAETSFTISKAESSVKTAPAGKSLTYDGTEQALINSGEALGGTLIYSTSEAGTFTDSIPTGKNVGDYTIWYMVIGDSNHSDSAKGSIASTVSPKTIGIQWSEENEYIYDGEEHCPSATVTGLADGDTCGANVTGAAVEVGNYTARVSGISNSNYVLPYEVTKEFKISEKTPENPVITSEPKGKTLSYDGGAQNLITAGTAVAGEMLYSLSETGEYTANIPTGKDAGEYTVWYMVKGAEGYNDIAPQSVKTTISPKEVGLEWSNTSFKYDGSEHCPSVKLTGVIDGDSCNVTVTGARKEIGVHTALATSITNPNYKLPGNNTKEFSIYDPTKKTGTVTVSMNGFVYGGKASSPVITSQTNDVSKASVVYKSANESDLGYKAGMPSEAGNYIVKVTLPSNDEYNACTATAGFSITYLAVPENAYFIRGTKGNDDWYTSKVQISPGQGYQISLGDRNHFTENPVTLGTNINQVSVYIRDASTMEQTDVITIGNFKIDNQAPEVEDMDSNEVYFAGKDGTVTCIVSDDNLSYVVIGDNKVELTDLGNGRKSFAIPVGAKKETVSFTACDLAGNKTEFKVITAPSWKRDGVIDEGEIYLEEGEKFKIPEGKWVVDGDGTVYVGGTIFYASREGMYTFKKQ